MELGYACINMTLSENPEEKRVTTNRSMIKKTFKSKGLPYASQLALQNVKDLTEILKWNQKRKIKFFRMSSDLFPWMSEYEFQDLPDFKEISERLKVIGDYATKKEHRLTFHPGPFNCMGSPKYDVVKKTFKELRQHSEIFDLMGFEPSPHNKINIHVGGTYGCKDGTAAVFCAHFKSQRIGQNCMKRLTLENDDKASMWSTKDIYDKVHQYTGIPIVFDYHHHRFCTGGQTEEEALKLAVSTWPAGVKPVVHLSESRAVEQGDPKIRPQAHSDFIKKSVKNYGQVYDMMLECKKKELGLIEYRSTFNRMKRKTV